MGAIASARRAIQPASAQPEALSSPPPSDGTSPKAKSMTAAEDDSGSIASSLNTAAWSTNTLLGSLLGRHKGPARILDKKDLTLRPETREFYENLDAFFELKRIIESIAEHVMPENALKEYDDIQPPNGLILQECVPEGDLLTQLDLLYSLAEETKPIFDSFCRNLVFQVGLDPDANMLEQATVTWHTHTAAPLKARHRAMEKAQREYASDARRLVDIVRASIVVDTETTFEAVVKCLNEDYVSHERDGVRVVRFKNRCKKPLADGQRDVLYNIGVMLENRSLRFVCELQIHMKQILDYKGATHGPYEYFRSYFKGGDGDVTARLKLLAQFRGDVDDISQIVTSALEADDEDRLDALDKLLYKLSELEIVILIRRRLLQLARSRTHFRQFERGKDYLKFARRLGQLAVALFGQGKYDEAKLLIQRSLRIQETNLGDHHPDVATSLNYLAILLCQQGKYDEAKPLYIRSLRIQETNLGEHHPDVATSLNNLAILLCQQGKYNEAKPLYERSLRIQETHLGEHHPLVASSLNNLALLLCQQGKYDEAKPLYERSLRIQETHLGEHHPEVATSLNNLGELFRAQGKYDEAKPLYERSLRIQETHLGEHHPDVATSLNNLAILLCYQGKYDVAKPLMERSLRIQETSLGEHHPGVAETLANLALLALDEGKLADAAQNIERAKHIFENTLGTAHPHTTKAHRIYADMSSRLKAAAQQ